jgi:hypothetical protein
MLSGKPTPWIANGGPAVCAHCGHAFPHDPSGMRIEAQVGTDGRLYCYGRSCDQDALEAAAIRRRRAS